MQEAPPSASDLPNDGGAHDMTPDAVMATVARCWQASLDHEAFDPDRKLIDTGADSLRVMQFVLRLEQALARNVPYDILSPETTPRTLVASLCEAEDGSPGLPRLFYLSGLAGTDYRMVGNLRDALGDRITITHVDPPGLDHPPALHRDMPATAAWIADQVANMQPAGPIRIAGYSIGGFQAFEVARQLIERGRQVAFLCLFDPIPRRSIARIVRDTLRRPTLLTGKIGNHMPPGDRLDRKPVTQSRLVDLALRFGAYGIASRAVRMTRPKHGSAGYDEADLFELWHRRLLAAKRWRPQPLSVNALLVLTDDGARFAAASFWQKWIERLTILRVPGSHDALSKTPVSENLRAALLAQLSRRYSE